MQNTDQGYYDFESERYSQKRYEGVSETYVQYFFKNRRSIIIRNLKNIIGDRHDLTLLDVACADGVITRSTDRAFPNVFSKLVGVDIAPQMVSVAIKKTNDSRFNFYTKDNCPIMSADIALGTGYLALPIFHSEMEFLMPRLKSKGYYICTLTSNYSLYSILKLKDNPLRSEYTNYSEYEKLLGKYFDIIKKNPNGLFLPKLWAVPFLGRLIQPLLEFVFKPFPFLYHEVVYIVQKKS